MYILDILDSIKEYLPSTYKKDRILSMKLNAKTEQKIIWKVNVKN